MSKRLPVSHHNAFVTHSPTYTRRAVLARLANTARALPAHTAQADVPFTPTAHFYRELRNSLPVVDREHWLLTLRMPDGTAHSYRYEQLLALPQHELDATLCSAGVPGKAQIAHARWHGVLLSDLRENSAQDMFLRSANILSMDGKSTEISREQWQRALLAFTINGEPLPASLGYPARLIVPGSYDQHSPGWVTRIHFAHEQPTHASEDTPLLAAITSHHQNTRHSGVLHLSGVAYAGLADISQVEVSIDDADWMPIAFTRAAPGCWSTWSAEWQPALPGSVALTVRATDDAGRISLPHRIRIIIENI